MEKNYVSLKDYFYTSDTSDDSPFLIQGLFDKLKLIHESGRKATYIDENNIYVDRDDISYSKIESNPIMPYEDKDEIIKQDLINLYCLAFGLYIFEEQKSMNINYIIKNREILRENFDTYATMVIPTEDISEYRKAIVDGNPDYLTKTNKVGLSSTKGHVYILGNSHPTGTVGNEDEEYNYGSNVKGFAATIVMALLLTVTVTIMTILAYMLVK